MAIVEYVGAVSTATAERPLRIFLNGLPVALSQGSPYNVSELAIGYLLSEGLISDRNQLIEVYANEEASEIYVLSDERAEVGYIPLHRVTSAGCSQSALLQNPTGIPEAPRIVTLIRFDADDLLACMEELCLQSPRRNTGECVHGCGLAAPGDASLLLVREDIGRHNAMDKLIGQAWLDRFEVSEKALFITGRISVEMALKAHRAGCPVLVSHKSATDEAIRRAEVLGLTLVSHCREGKMRVLSCSERITT